MGPSLLRSPMFLRTARRTIRKNPQLAESLERVLERLSPASQWAGFSHDRLSPQAGTARHETEL